MRLLGLKTLLNKLLLVVLILLFSGCDKTIEEVKTKDKIEKIIESMSIEEKIGQMLIIDYDSDTLSEEMVSKMNEIPPSGFILLKNNITTYEKTKNLVNDMKDNSKHPLIISIDEEGGNVQRIKNLTDVSVTDIPFMYELGNIDDIDLTYEVGKVIAEELRTIGVNVDFAPDIDVFSNPNNTVIGKRSFGSNPNQVALHGLELSKSLEENKVISVFKHFPGHGDTDVDSHSALPIVSKSLEELDSTEFIPFKRVIPNAKMIMVGHIALPNITGDNTPSSLSKKVIDILKNDLSYDGLIITDALNMGALTDNYTNEDIYVKAIEAGCDLLLMPNDGIDTIGIIKDKVSKSRIDNSVRKILKFKYKYLSQDNSLDSSYLNSEEHQNIINKLYEN